MEDIYNKIYSVTNENMKGLRKIDLTKEAFSRWSNIEYDKIDMNYLYDTDNESFLEAAYLALLNRTVDFKAREFWKLRFNDNKEEFQRELLNTIINSMEFKLNNVEVINNKYNYNKDENISSNSTEKGIGEFCNDLLQEDIKMVNSLHYIDPYKNITSDRKVTGKIIIFIKKVIRKLLSWYITPMVEQQNEFNAFTTKVLNSINEKIVAIEVDRIQSEGNFNNKLLETYSNFNNKLLETALNFNNKLKAAEENISNQFREIEEKKKINLDYVAFENKYRGSQELIRSRLKVYLKYFEKENNILDIGCGRGEFLELLRENNIQAKGIDVNEEMILLCKEKKLNIANVDALKYLSELEDNSLGGIILTQVIEHLEPNYLIDLISLSYKKLKPGAYFIAETINPQSLIVFTQAYFMDLSHIRMIHPYTVKFLVEQEGFKDASLEYFSEVPESVKIPQINELPEDFNQAMVRLNNLVYGSRDYAIIGRK
ncbi:class I SAM-dependent methyltransferase [Clostridium beijerinckii]|uniref:Class I SAM-dependent methyltransferase n=1 Tax=Clostridium beijerinckii TaxID=1520 RepID=A0AAW3W2U5_CLOBE|nr:class I SAM-dependent methyltransferase [Clostridium beijerinckii]MBC2455744.1 class I SAM-dependent methyltransferase [Clostridium beijerinckii]MBC2473221.1 class I SAM-dependent methyltransferase [Clostridium beijerinckii]NOV62270.1 O-antigen chain-terminating methyltransferase [Clostridium beijerinckii]NOV68233.1 O-antigen chain-terminating methyltransferase [Clostridium beijerinckii]NOW30322.1 O-antigen chain-terminating methyltransferase [Clostridium beijerinckii]